MSNLALQWYPGELETWGAKEELSTSMFAEKYRSVTIGAHRGQWDNSVTPYLVGIMDTADLPCVEELVISGPPQSGKTNACINILLKHIYQFGGNGKFIMFPTELLAKLFYRVRLVPILQGHDILCNRLSPDPRDTTSEKVSLRDGTHLFPAWGSSAAKLSSFPADLVWADEIDKNADLTGDESDPLSLLEDRVRTARRRLIMKCSSPTLETGHIWKALNKCLYVMRQYAVCPHCGEEQRMDETRITWPGQAGLFDRNVSGISQPDAEPEILKSHRLARYLCAACLKPWDDQERNAAVKVGGWKTDDGVLLADALATRPRSVGFQIEGFFCPDISLSHLAAEIITARSGDPAAEKRRDNSFFGRPHQPKVTVERKEDTILRLRDNRPAGMVPADADALEISIDTQDNGFWYRIRAWQYGLSLTSWLVKSGYLASATPDDFSPLDALLAAEYPDENGEPYRIMAGIIDSAGHRTAAVYDWCRRTGVLAAKGASGRKVQPVTVSRLDRFPSNNRVIPGGLALYSIDTHYHKDLLANKLLIDPTDPGAMILHSGFTYDQMKAMERDPSQKFSHNLGDYARQMCSEYRDDRNLWQCPRNTANHLWDCESNGLALVTWLGWQHAVSDKVRTQPAPHQQTGKQQPVGNDRPGWFNNR